MPEKKREELRARRAPLVEQLEEDPNQTELALEIKVIDDQIAECTRQIQQKRRPSSQ
jgi:hypothetical protein